MHNKLLCTLLLFTNCLMAYPDSSQTPEEEQEEALFYLIQQNVCNLKHRGASDEAARELMNLLEEGYMIDPFNMTKLIETLTYVNASDNAKNVILKAIAYNSPLTSDHLFLLIQTLAQVNAADHATTILLKAIECGIKFRPTERLHLAELSKIVNAKPYVETIREALHAKNTSR